MIDVLAAIPSKAGRVAKIEADYPSREMIRVIVQQMPIQFWREFTDLFTVAQLKRYELKRISGLEVLFEGGFAAYKGRK